MPRARRSLPRHATGFRLRPDVGSRADGGVVIALPISQEELAGWAAASRAGMAAALRTLRELGWIETDRRRITVRDLGALRARASVQNWMETEHQPD
jgi:CRP-like cAMP-binding protein